MKNEVFNSPNYKKIIIGNVILYVQKLKLTAVKNYVEKSTASSTTCITNRNSRATKIVVDAKMHISDNFSSQVVYLENSMRNNSLFTFTTDNITFTNAEITSVIFKDECQNGFASCQVIFVTQNKLEENE